MFTSLRSFFPALCIIALVSLCFPSCLISEREDITITLNPDGNTGSIVFIRHNVQSDQSTQERIQRDFAEFLEKWKGDKYLIDKVAEGFYVRSREVFLEKNSLTWKEEWLFGDFHKLFKENVANDSLRFHLERSDIITATNGFVGEFADSIMVSWPISMRRFTLSLRRSQFTPTSDFAKLFKQLPKTPR